MSSSIKGKNVLLYDASENEYGYDGCDQYWSTMLDEEIDEIEEEEENSKIDTHDTTCLDESVESIESKVLCMEFTNCEDAEKFYNDYARMKGFSIRKQEIVRDKNKSIRQRLFVCSKQRFRDAKWLQMNDTTREAKPLTRTGCEESFRVTLDKDTGLFDVTLFNSEHNHDLAPLEEVHFLRSHRNVSPADQAYAMALKKAGVKTCQVMNFQIQQHGGHQNVGYLKKDLYNRIQEDRTKRLIDGDAEGALGYLHAKARIDPEFFCKYDVDEENRLCRLFWADGRSRADYSCFGDVLMFDTTYMTNAYKKPLVILCGVNNHYRTVVFGSALLVHETTSTYEWMLERFLEAMDGKIPSSVITDGCKAMHSAINKYFPCANHRLCSWHLNRNASDNIKIAGFGEAFNILMKTNCDLDEFEDAWIELVADFGIENHKWINDTYERRKMWAHAYLRGMFFANMISTQRCESMNSFMKKHVNVRLRLFEFIEAYDSGLDELRNTEAGHKSNTSQTYPVLRTDMPLEKHAADVFTRNVYSLIRKELDDVVKLFGVETLQMEDHDTYFIGHYANPRNHIRVKYFNSTHVIECNCLKFEGCGIPCAYMFYVMIAKRLRKIPQSCILHRWTRNARSSSIYENRGKEQSSKQLQMARFGILSSLCGKACYYASQSIALFGEAQSEIIKLSERMQNLFHENQVGQSQNNPEPRSMVFDVRDPSVVPTRKNANPTKKVPTVRRCRRCGCVGHRKDTCPKKGVTSTNDASVANTFNNEYANYDGFQDCSPCSSSFTSHLMSYDHQTHVGQVDSAYGQYDECSIRQPSHLEDYINNDI